MMSATFEPAATRDWDFPRYVAGTALLVALGSARGLDPALLLRGTGLGARDVADHRREVTAAQELRVVRNLLAADPRVTGAEAGAAYHASTFGPLGFALLSSPTLGDAANLALRFIDLSFSFTPLSAVVEDGAVVVTGDEHAVPPDVRAFVVERDLAAIWTVLREICGGAPRLNAVGLPFPAPDDDAAAGRRAAFGVAPRWASRSATLRFDASWLDLRLPQANAHAFALAESLCLDLVSPRRDRRRHGIAEEVRILVAQRLEDGAPMAAVAAALGLSERSLRRRLQDAGMSYRTLLDEVRALAAERLLADPGLTLDDIAERLGYAEATSLVVAYRRWTGRTPRGLRPPRPGPSRSPA
ncbi:AraC family transcriptional regulator [Pimelobacter simplex]|uniref:AraC family transcriptional regulator n=1 Tax=Nocardioides simplex TaxID=2045 RepID=UPI00214FA113|nr:AraC family transcriptional regulator [Pimelobacter simplex]UUW88028.1 AraC family transcriptional regulator [Pimelobacter simplex]UUW97532.1 AraC family transcriptional regulator [Pimelobacter simplex]